MRFIINACCVNLIIDLVNGFAFCSNSIQKSVVAIINFHSDTVLPRMIHETKPLIEVNCTNATLLFCTRLIVLLTIDLIMSPAHFVFKSLLPDVNNELGCQTKIQISQRLVQHPIKTRTELGNHSYSNPFELPLL